MNAANYSIGQRMAATLGAVVVLMVASGMFSHFLLRSSVDTYNVSVQHRVMQERTVARMESDFKAQVLEWKNTLLRGEDARKRELHWTAFQTYEKRVAESAERLRPQLTDPHEQAALEKFAAAHARMAIGYRKGFEDFQALGFVPGAGDADVADIDRAPAQLLSDLSRQIARSSAEIAAAAATDGRRAGVSSLGALALVSVLAIVLGWLLTRSVVRPLHHAVEIARRVAAGDLTSRMTVAGKDEASRLLEALAEMQANLERVVLQVRVNAEGVADASAEIAAGNADLSLRTEDQALSLNATTASMQQLQAAAQTNASSASQASERARNGMRTAEGGGQAVQQLVAVVQGIQESARRMADIIAVIDSIAFQTNVLALNAAVEAARAGEQGRGFAVVAGEVRTLANRSSEAAREIKNLIQSSGDQVETGTTLANEAGDIIGQVVEAIREVSRWVDEISAANASQTRDMASMTDAVVQMDQATQQNAALVEQSAAAAENLQGQARGLVKAVAVFRLHTSIPG